MEQGGEMCGALLMYYPHDPAHRFDWGAIVEDPPRIAPRRDVCFDWSMESQTCLRDSARVWTWGAEEPEAETGAAAPPPPPPPSPGP